MISISRDGETIFPRASTHLEAGDIALIMSDVTKERELRAYLEGVSVPA